MVRTESVGGMRISREDREIARGKYNKAKMEKEAGARSYTALWLNLNLKALERQSLLSKGLKYSLGYSLGVEGGGPSGSTVKNLPAMQDLIPASGRLPGEGSGIPLQYSCQ